jgi:hypothetical protein
MPASETVLNWTVAWNIPDEETYDTAAAVRDELDRRVLRLLADLLQQ